MCCFSSCASPQGFSLMRLDPGCWERIRYKENCRSTSHSRCVTTAKYKGAKQRCLHLHTNMRRDGTCREKLCLLGFVTSSRLMIADLAACKIQNQFSNCFLLLNKRPNLLQSVSEVWCVRDKADRRGFPKLSSSEGAAVIVLAKPDGSSIS